MENLLRNRFIEIVGHSPDEHALREVGDLRGRNQRFQLRIGRSRNVLVRDRMRLAHLHDLAEALRQGAGRVAHDLPGEDIADCIDDDLRLLLPVVALQLREILNAQADGNLVRTGRSDQVIQSPDVDRRKLVDDERRFQFPLFIDKPDKT